MIGESNPLVLVFYIDRATISNPEFMNVFGESVNETIRKKGANMMAFFLPTDTEERVECINPVQLSEVDMNKVNKLVNDIALQFDMKETNDIRDYSFLNKSDCSYSFKSKWDYNGWKDNLATLPFNEPFQESWTQTLTLTIDNLLTSLADASRKEINNIRAHSCMSFLIEQLFEFTEDSSITINYDDTLETDVIYVFSNDIFNLKIIPAYRNGGMVNIPIEDATESEISEHKRRLWGYVKIENYEESDRI